jgi:ADP-dependent NAD(P)H-hydrate dehydratase / NAD(P)H-hydrate epimerase
MDRQLGTENLYSAAQTRQIDRAAIDDCGIPGISLMARAARAGFSLLLDLWPEVESIEVLCGTGNNGGDGYLIAELAHQRGISAVVYQLGDTEKVGGDARQARDHALANGVREQAYTAGCLSGRGVVVDAMLGTGLTGDVRGDYGAAIEAVNRGEGPVLAVDIPSGLCSDTGRVLGCAVRADATITFIGLKRGMFTLDAPDYTGAIQFTDLAVPAPAYDAVPATCQRLELDNLLQRLPERPANSHKGSYGTVLVVGGDYGMAGAAAMAAESALRCGAGLVRVATREEHVAPIVSRVPEAMARGVRSGQELEALLGGVDVLVVGPGLGASPWSEQLLRVAAASGLPMVLDADGLNLLITGRIVDNRCRDNWVLTPHPGEAARLLGVSTTEIQADRFAAIGRLQQQYGGVAVLKGSGTLVAAGGGVFLSDYGNPGMASGGMGDVLSGVIGGLVAQRQPLLEAAALAVCVHGAAADIAAEAGQRGLLATDLLAPMRELLG